MCVLLFFVVLLGFFCHSCPSLIYLEKNNILSIGGGGGEGTKTKSLYCDMPHRFQILLLVLKC